MPLSEPSTTNASMPAASRAGQRVLFVAIPAVGHINPLLAQARELGRRGWHTALASCEELRPHVERGGVRFVSLGPNPVSPEAGAGFETLISAEVRSLRGAFMMLAGLNSLWPAMYDALGAAIAADRPDLLVVDLMTGAGVDAALAAGIPYVVNNPDLLTLVPTSTLPPVRGIPPAGFGRSIHDLGAVTCFLAPGLTRASNAFLNLLWSWQLRSQRRARGLPWQAGSRSRFETLILVDSAFGLEYPRPLPPLVRMVGPMIEPDSPPLPDDLLQWLAGDEPVVYVNLGTVVRPGADALSRIAGGLAEAGVKTLWALREPLLDALPSAMPDNVRIACWLPSQIAVLAHPQVKAFVSHCGINSVHESLSLGVPIVGLPFLADQRDMAMRVQDAGAGLVLDKVSFSASSLSAAIRRVLDEPRFAEAIPAIQDSFTAAGGVSRAADLIEQAAAGRLLF